MDLFGASFSASVVITVLVVHGLIFGVFCQFVAYQKGRDGVTWFYIGFFFGVIALLALIGLGKPDAKEATSVLDANDDMDCPKCAERIKKRAKICRFCGFDLSQDHG